MNFADRLNELMAEKKLSNLKLAKETGLSDRLIGGWRKEEGGINLSSALVLANFFGVSLDYLAGRSEVRSMAQEETKKAPALEISENGRRMLEIYLLLDKEQQAFLLGEASGMLRENEKKRGLSLSEGKAV